MASPQTEDGHTKIANDIMDALCRTRIPGEERQVLDAILRKTYGWNKCEDAIALSQFVEMTGLKKPNVIRAIRGLLSKAIITVIKSDNANGKVYKFNKDFESWEPLSKPITLSKPIISVIESDNPSLSKAIPTKDTTTKDTITKAKAREFILPEWIKKETWDAYREMRQRKRAPLTDRASVLIIRELEKLKAKGHEPEDVLDQSIMKSWAGVFPIKAERESGKGMVTI